MRICMAYRLFQLCEFSDNFQLRVETHYFLFFQLGIFVPRNTKLAKQCVEKEKKEVIKKLCGLWF